MPSWLEGVDERPLVVPATTFDQISSTLQEAYRLPNGRPAARKRTLSTEEVRAYVRGRASLADDRPSEALRWFRSAADANAPEVRIGIADALGRVGRRTEMTSILWPLAIEDDLPSDWEPILIDGLVQQRRFADAIAVLLRSIERTDRGVVQLAGWITIADLVADLDRSSLAASIRRTLLENFEGSWSSLAKTMPGNCARFLRQAGDDAIRTGDLEAAERRWSEARSIQARDPATRRRMIWVSARLGLDSQVASLLLEASAFPGDVDLQAAVWARENGVDLRSLAGDLRNRLVSDPDVLGTARMLVATDPANAARDLRGLAERRPDLELAEAIVAASLPSGPLAAIESAGAVVDGPATLDAAVDLLIGGPWESGPLLEAAVASSDVMETPVVAAEILRKFGRLDLAARRLESASDTATGSVLRRIAGLRLYGDAGDAVLVRSVSELPTSLAVESARVRALAACGEPEIAFALATELLAGAPDDPSVLIERSRAAEALLGSRAIAFEDALRAYEETDSAEAAVLLVDLVASEESEAARVASGIRRTIAQLELDEDLRRLIAADRAWRRGDMSSVVSELEPMLGSSTLRERVLVRLLPAWRGLGRLDDALRTLRRIQWSRPADPVISDAIFAIERTARDPRDMAIELRAEADHSIDGLVGRRLEILLSDIKESRPELLLRRRVELARRPAGPARRIEELLLDIESDEGGLSADRIGVDLRSLPERLRRRAIAVLGLLPAEESIPILEGILEFHRTQGLPVDVDTAAVAITMLGPQRGLTALNGLRPLEARTRLDPTWTDRIVSLGATDADAAASLARYAVGGLTPEESTATLLRLGIAMGILAGDSAVGLIDTLERSLAMGWSPTQSWGMEDGEPLALRGVSSDAVMLGDRRLGTDILHRLVELEPTSALALNNLGFGLLMLGDLDGAREALDRSYELDPVNPSTLDSLGWLRYAEGRHDPADPDGAVALIRRSIDLRIRAGVTPSPEVMLHLGDASWKAGLRDNALSAWRTVVDLGARRDSRERIRILDRYQESVWGAVIVPSKALDYHLDGQWIEAAESRLRAWENGGSPAVTDFSDPPEERPEAAPRR